jgi:hypothetical protein
LPLALIREFVHEMLESLKATTGDFLTGGVTVSALQPLVPVPFRIVYVLGLGESLFPGSNAISSVDLRGRERCPGDIRPAESNRFLFLQALLAAREKVYLFYNCRDLQKDQVYHPCSPVNQLRRFLQEHVFAGKHFEITPVPLLGSDPRYLEGASAHSVSDVMVTYSRTERLLAIDEAQRTHRLQLDARQTAEVTRRLREARRTFRLPAAGGQRARGMDTPTISMSELRGFLRCPAEAALKRHLRLADEAAIEPKDDEPFYTGFPYNYRLVSETLNRFVDRAVQTSVEEALRDWRPRFRALHQEWRLRGWAPEEAFAEVDLAGFEDILAERIERSGDLARFLRTVRASEYHGPLLLGEALIPLKARRRFPALRLPLASGDLPLFPVVVRLVGALARIWRTSDAVDILVLNASGKNVSAEHLCFPLLEPILFVLALKAGTEPAPDGASSRAWLGERTVRLHVAHNEGVGKWSYGPEDISAAEAQAYLEQLTGDFLTRNSFDLLPFDLVAAKESLRAAYLSPAECLDPAQYAQLLEEEYEQDQDNEHPIYRAMKLLEIVEPLVPSDALAKLDRRFRLLDRGPARARSR